MAPMEPPVTESSRAIPKWSINIFCSRTMSGIVTGGNDMAYGQPVAGLTELGPEVPRQPPRTFEQITKYLSVSNPLPGPIMLAHHPALVESGSAPEACASPEKACRIRMALFLAAFNAP